MFNSRKNSMKYSSNKDVHQFICALIKHGWKFQKRRKHGVLIEPVKSVKIFISTSPSDWRALLKIKQDIRQAGYDLKAYSS